MEHESRRPVVLLVASLALLALLAVAALGGLAFMSTAVQRTDANTSVLRYNARRGDCIRDIQGGVDQQFRQDITDLLSDGRDPQKVAVIVRRMEAEAKVNYADTVKKKCPPTIQGGK